MRTVIFPGYSGVLSADSIVGIFADGENECRVQPKQGHSFHVPLPPAAAHYLWTGYWLPDAVRQSIREGCPPDASTAEVARLIRAAEEAARQRCDPDGRVQAFLRLVMQEQQQGGE